MLAETFSCIKKKMINNSEKRELATFDGNRRAEGIADPMRDKNEGTHRGGEGTTPVTTVCPE